MLIDLANLEWWQTLVAIAAALGLSPAPWILGLALGRIQFAAPAERETDKRIADLKEAHALELKNLTAYHEGILKGKDERYADVKESRDGYKAATVIERERADKVTDTLAEFGELGKLAVHALAALDEVAKERGHVPD